MFMLLPGYMVAIMILIIRATKKHTLTYYMSN